MNALGKIISWRIWIILSEIEAKIFENFRRYFKSHDHLIQMRSPQFVLRLCYVQVVIESSQKNLTHLLNIVFTYTSVVYASFPKSRTKKMTGSVFNFCPKTKQKTYLLQSGS